MPVDLGVYDEKPGAEPSLALTLRFLNESISVRELIRERVYQEVRERNAEVNGRYATLAEKRSEMGWKTPDKPPLTDWETQYHIALERFERNRFFVLVDDRQLASLDDDFTITPTTSVRFIQLVPLKGG